MNFGFSEEQEELRKMVKRFLEEKSPESEVRRLMATSEGYDPAVWEQMAKELALQGLGIPEEFGGQGYGPVELYVVFEEMGAALFCSPYFSTVALAAHAIGHREQTDDGQKPRENRPAPLPRDRVFGAGQSLRQPEPGQRVGTVREGWWAVQ